MGIVELERTVLGNWKFLSNELIEGVEVTPIVKRELLGLSVALKAYVWGENAGQKEQEVRYPLTWWDALKERWFPGWLKNIVGVEWHVTKLSVKVLYPQLQISLAEQPHSVVVFRSDADYRIPEEDEE